MSIVLLGSTSGSCTLQEQAVAGTSVLTLPVGTGTVVANNVNSAIVSETAQASTSGTSIDFTSIPSWVKRITVMFAGVSTSGTSPFIIQLGSGTVTTTGYESGAWSANTSNVAGTTGFVLTGANQSTGSYNGTISLVSFGSNKWVESGTLGQSVNPASLGGGNVSGGQLTLGGTLDRVRITTTGADTFDAGSINILYE